MFSRLSYLICAAVLLYAGLSFYPKWEQKEYEATLSWDVSGYYLYLPAFFIYEDAKRLEFMPNIIDTYRPTPNMQQAYPHESGNYVMKYSLGQAVMYSPFFAVAHQVAKRHPDYPADGFSRPYQMGIGLGGLFVALLGLWFLRKILLRFFEDKTVAVVLLLLVCSTHYLEYAGITNAMSHNWLFTLQTILVLWTMRFYEVLLLAPSREKSLLTKSKTTTESGLSNPFFGGLTNPRGKSFLLAAGIGVCIGLAALTRPTEIIVALIPLLWGMQGVKKVDWQARLELWKSILPQLALAIGICISIGCLQIAYWKYATGDFIVYSYEDQGFSWLTPHLKDCLVSFRAGWLIYTPTMAFALLGYRALYRHYPRLFWVTLAYTGLHIYITFAWDIWWYGGSLGQRALIQAYPMLCLPLAAFISQIWKKNWLKYLFFALSLLFTVYNFWLIQQSRPGKLMRPGEMSGAYWQEILFKQEVPLEAQKLLDTREQFKGERKAVTRLFEDNFDDKPLDSLYMKFSPEASDIFLQLDGEQQYSPTFRIERSAFPEGAKWLRVQGDFVAPQKEWEPWRMTQMIVKFWRDNKNVKTRYIRLHRLLKDGELKTIWLDMRLPRREFTHVEVTFWNATNQKTILINNFALESFQ